MTPITALGWTLVLILLAPLASLALWVGWIWVRVAWHLHWCRHYTKLSIARLDRWDRKVAPPSELVAMIQHAERVNYHHERAREILRRETENV